MLGMAAKKRSNNGAGLTQVIKPAKSDQSGRLHRVRANRNGPSAHYPAVYRLTL
jgi:hypothetical protein